jgi:hypothetical protein
MKHKKAKNKLQITDFGFTNPQVEKWRKIAMELAYALEREGYPDQCYCRPEPDFENEDKTPIHKNYCQEIKELLKRYELLRGGNHVHL